MTSAEATGCLACGRSLREGPGHGWQRCAGCRSWRRAQLPTRAALHEAHERLYFRDDAPSEMTADHLLSQYVAAFDDRVGLDGFRVLDVGAGTGAAAPWVTARGGQYAALESSETAREQLRASGWPAYADPEQARTAGAFDVALAIEVVEHLLDPARFLRDVRSCLAPGGMLYLTTPNAASLHGRLRGGRWWAAVLPAHVALYTVEGLDALFAASGLTRHDRHRRVDYGKGPWHRTAQGLLQLVGGDGGLRVLARAV